MKDTLDENTDRKAWMGLLAKAPTGRVSALLDTSITRPDFAWLRAPEIGSTMVRARAGATGAPFNLGEMTVTRCAVRLAEGETGVSYIAGRNLEHALIAAKADALLQSETHHDKAFAALIEPLQKQIDDREAERASKVAATRVNFFTMVRTREDKK